MWQSVIQTIASIWRQNMLGYLSANIICSEKWTVLPERSSKKTVSYEEQIMSKDKYLSIFSKSNGGYCLNYPSNIFRNMRGFKTGEYLTIIPRAQMGYESITHEAEGRMGYWFRAHEGERNTCFSKIQLVGQKNIETKHLSLVKARL